MVELFFKKIECPKSEEVSQDELSWAKSLTSTKRRNEFLCGRALLRQIARDKYGLSDITIVYDGQKPRLLNNEFYFSISHSKNLLVLAVNDKSVGVDVEYVDSKRSFKKIIKRFSENVRSEFFNLPEEKRLEYFFEIWTNYEALIKLRGKTLATCDFNPKECGVLFENKRFEKDYILSVATSH